uniref:OSJNBa0042L16.15 protein n=1 Tax=Oryza sativa subsp. japonica TaxID=39947 RepID=Q7XT87_ORYSJ|nr:OSJNBa0042L16.15 [Oryza sativa Japonica Group]
MATTDTTIAHIMDEQEDIEIKNKVDLHRQDQQPTESLDERLVTVDEVRVALAHCLQTALEVGAPRSTKPRMVRKAGASLISGAI